MVLLLSSGTRSTEAATSAPTWAQQPLWNGYSALSHRIQLPPPPFLGVQDGDDPESVSHGSLPKPVDCTMQTLLLAVVKCFCEQSKDFYPDRKHHFKLSTLREEMNEWLLLLIPFHWHGTSLSLLFHRLARASMFGKQNTQGNPWKSRHIIYLNRNIWKSRHIIYFNTVGTFLWMRWIEKLTKPSGQ